MILGRNFMRACSTQDAVFFGKTLGSGNRFLSKQRTRISYLYGPGEFWLFAGSMRLLPMFALER